MSAKGAELEKEKKREGSWSRACEGFGGRAGWSEGDVMREREKGEAEVG